VPTHHTLYSKHGPRHWMRAGFFLISFSAIALLSSAFRAHYLRGSLSSLLLTFVLIALCAAIALHVRFLLLVHREHKETARALDVTEREYKSVFDSALDGILILDDQGVCLDANPAALNLFRTSRGGLVGESMERFFAGTGEFKKAWDRFLDRKNEYRDTRVLRGDGATIFVEYTARAHYMPGRHLAVVRDISRRKQAEAALQESEERFQQMASNIEEIFWMLDARTKEVLYVNPAYQTITGRRPSALLWKDPKSYQDVVHPEDRARVLSRLRESADTGDQLDEEFRILRPDNRARWVWVRGFPVRDSAGTVLRLVGTVQDISARKSAEAEMARNLDLAESAREEAEAFRRTSLALTENLSMDYVLDTLLQSLLKLVPCESARVLLVEADTRLFLAREAQNSESSRAIPKFPKTLDAKDSSFLMRVLVTRNSLLIPNTAEEREWASFRGFSPLRSWLCVPLVASQQVLGMLSLGDARARTFTPEHLRIAKSLAIPAAVAIQNARLYERAAIYGAELEQRLADLETAEQALRVAEQSRTISEDRFAKVFRSSPIASSITTAEEGLFVDINHAFERRYGYCREQLIGRTVFDIGIWDDPDERRRMLSEIREQGRVRHRMTCFRNRKGELLETIYSAETIELDGRQCLLAVSEDVPNRLNTESLLRQRSAHMH
jgi:PAS domain S-box-containing protein